MLTLTLKGLERAGLVTRTVYPTVPPRVDYALTPLGRTLREPVSALAAWAERSREKMQLAREQFDQRATKTLPPAEPDLLPRARRKTLAPPLETISRGVPE